MARRTRAGVEGHETPRAKDLPRRAPSGRKVTPDIDKRAKKATSKALIAFLRKHGADDVTVARWLREYRAFVRGLPSRSASVCDLVANRVRNGYLAESYSLSAKEAGVASPAGAKLAQSAHGCDMHVQRFSLHARDLAYREAGIPISEEGTEGTARISLSDLDELLAVGRDNAEGTRELAARPPEVRVVDGDLPLPMSTPLVQVDEPVVEAVDVEVLGPERPLSVDPPRQLTPAERARIALAQDLESYDALLNRIGSPAGSRYLPPPQPTPEEKAAREDLERCVLERMKKGDTNAL